MLKKKSKKPHKKNYNKDENLLKKIEQIGQIGHDIEKTIKNFEQKVENRIEDIGHEINREAAVVIKEVKKKITLFYKISLPILVLLAIVLSYFIILVSTTPKSFPFVTKEVRQQLHKNYGDSVSFEDAFISFTRYGTIKVSVRNLKILREKFLSQPEIEFKNQFAEKKEILFPIIEGEFSILNLINASFSPRTIRIIDPEIFIDDFANSSQSEKSDSEKFALIISALSNLKGEKLLTKSFEIENAKFIFGSQNNSKIILLKKAQIRAYAKNDILYLSSVNNISFSANKSDVNLNTSCQLVQYNSLKCDLFLVNFVSNSLAELHPNLKFLEQTNATLNANTSFTFDQGKFYNVNFKVDAKSGSFTFLNFFSQTLFFSDFIVKGQYDDGLGILNLSEIHSDFLMHDDLDIANPNSKNLKTHFDMSLLISNLKDHSRQRHDFYIKLQNAPINQLEKLWPVYLSDKGIRDWVVSHVKNGFVQDAYARFSLIKENDQSILEKINSKLVFSSVDLNYAENFPEITRIDGVANFNEKSMNIKLTSGDVLGSKIFDSQVRIDDFNAPKVVLKILGKSRGDASDSLKHANNSSEFLSKIKKYLNGDSQSNFDIEIPLSDDLTLKNSYIAVDSEIKNLSNDYVKGAVKILVKKNFFSENFITNIDLKNSELAIKELNIQKKSGFDGGLSLSIFFPDPKIIELQNISLWKKEVVLTGKKTRIVSAKIEGDLKAEIAPLLVTSFNFKNQNFGRNSYLINYQASKKLSFEKLLIRGQVLDLAPYIENKFFGFSKSNKNFRNLIFQASVDNLLLANYKAIKNFAFNLKCSEGFCYSGFVRGSYNQRGQSLNINLLKKITENFTTIEGQITDVGYLAEALGISKVIAGGNAHLKLQNKLVNKKPFLEGEINFDDSITIFENPSVKRLASNDLFSKVRDKIFSNNKITFDSVKLQLAMGNNNLEIKSLIANNYKIGITAKGNIDLKNNAYQIKGMIVPGFIINNLFGIGNIPVLGSMISGLLTGGEGGGVFAVRYQYVKKPNDKEATFETNKISAFIPTTIKNLFD